MLTILHPEAKLMISDFACGLLPLRLGDDKQFSLIVKTQKEAILAAKINGGFSFYLPLLRSTTVTTTALITAFFDDDDYPLNIRSPLFENDPDAHAILDILSYNEVDVYFFDELNHEWMSFKTSLEDGGSWLISGEEIQLLEYHPKTLKSIHQVLVSWLAQRTPEDDERAIQAVFKGALAPNDIVFIDMTPEINDYQGSSGFRHDSLTRADPGYFQERDISACLLRSFEPQNVIMNPRRKDTFKEILDHLVLTDDVALLIQAKDSPTTEEGIGRTLSRKRRSTHHQIDDAIRQINGAASYLAREPIAKLVVDGQDIDISIGERRVIGLAIVKELFDDEGEVYATTCSKLSRLNGGGMVMDYYSFHVFTQYFDSEGGFVRALEAVIDQVRTSGWISVRDFVLDGVLEWAEEFSSIKPRMP